MKRRSYITSKQEDLEFLSLSLNEILACLRAQYLSYQTSHWQVSGSHFFQEHLLFERLYSSVSTEIDVLAEKIAGLVGSEEVSLQNQIPLMAEYLGKWASIPDHFRRGLTSEEDLQKLLRAVYDDITESGLMTLGLDDYLMATANSHEATIYLLQQTINPRTVNASSASDLFFADPRKVEVQEFANSNAVSNDPSTFENTLEEDRGHDSSLSVEWDEFEESPDTPEEILEMPGATELSTLNRYVVDSEDPDLDAAIKMNEKRAAIRKVLFKARIR